MKNKPISGNKAATPNTQPSSPCEKANPCHGSDSSHGNGSPVVSKANPPAANAAVPSHGSVQLQFDYVPSDPEYIEPLATRETVCKHYQIGMRTLTYAMSLGLPSVPIGRARRFKFSEVQPWFEKNGYRRIASEGRKLAIQKALLKAKQFHLALTQDVQVTNDPNQKNKPTKTHPNDGNKPK